jgi:hypothetical protein
VDFSKPVNSKVVDFVIFGLNIGKAFCVQLSQAGALSFTINEGFPVEVEKGFQAHSQDC